jgi:hypothetical protein
MKSIQKCFDIKIFKSSPNFVSIAAKDSRIERHHYDLHLKKFVSKREMYT